MLCGLGWLASNATAFQTLRSTATSTPFNLNNGAFGVAFAPTVHRNSNDRVSLRMTEDEDGAEEAEGPLAKGVDSVKWLPTVHGGDKANAAEDATVLPLFPLGGIVYTPNSEHVLNIFEPRYREMYNDILMNGSKRFVVSMSHPTERGRFAEMGVLFELEDLKEVSEQTKDQVKFVCRHRVTGRVRMHKILNPSAWEDRSTYLRVEGTLVDADNAGAAPERARDDDDEDDEDDEEVAAPAVAKFYEPAAPEREARLRSSFYDLVDLQHELEEDVRFTRASADTLAVSPGDADEGLWSTIRLWQSYSEQRLVARQNELQREFQEKLQDFLTKEKGVKEEELPSAIGFNDLSPELQGEVAALQKRMTVELEPLVLESTLSMQKILEAADHADRVDLIRFFVDAERKRLRARKVLRGMFTGSSDELEEEEEQPPSTPSSPSLPTFSDDDGPCEGTGPLLMDEEDAFQ